MCLYAKCAYFLTSAKVMLFKNVQIRQNKYHGLRLWPTLQNDKKKYLAAALTFLMRATSVLERVCLKDTEVLKNNFLHSNGEEIIA
jgi:hypothetical protein